MLLLSIHLAMNHRAVRAVSLRSLNRQRANIVFSHIYAHNKVLRPTEVSALERIFERSGVLRWSDDQILGRASIGVDVGCLLMCLGGERHVRTGARDMRDIRLAELVRLYAREGYLLWFDGEKREAVIVLKHGCKPIDQIQAWAQALSVARMAAQQKGVHAMKGGRDGNSVDRERSAFGLDELKETLEKTKEMLKANEERLRDVGWDLEIASLETTSGTRAMIKGLE